MSANTYLNDKERQILESATVGIAGAGGLGSNCAAHLVRAGLKRLVIADFDVVSESNLNRQFFFRDQLGRKKVDALSENLRRIEPDLDLVLHDVRLTPANAQPAFGNCQIIVEALDSAGWGRSRTIEQRRVGKNLILIGDTASDIRNGLAPVSPRVGIAAAMEANAVAALLLNKEI